MVDWSICWDHREDPEQDDETDASQHMHILREPEAGTRPEAKKNNRG